MTINILTFAIWILAIVPMLVFVIHLFKLMKFNGLVEEVRKVMTAMVLAKILLIFNILFVEGQLVFQVGASPLTNRMLFFGVSLVTLLVNWYALIRMNRIRAMAEDEGHLKK